MKTLNLSQKEINWERDLSGKTQGPEHAYGRKFLPYEVFQIINSGHGAVSPESSVYSHYCILRIAIYLINVHKAHRNQMTFINLNRR